MWLLIFTRSISECNCKTNFRNVALLRQKNPQDEGELKNRQQIGEGKKTENALYCVVLLERGKSLLVVA